MFKTSFILPSLLPAGRKNTVLIYNVCFGSLKCYAHEHKPPARTGWAEAVGGKSKERLPPHISGWLLRFP